MARLLVFVLCASMVTTQRNGNVVKDRGHDEHHELQRQNRITEQILTNFFERKFFPNRKPKPAPTIDEILPPESRANPSIRNKHSAQRENDEDEPDTDNLQSVESEHVDSVYRDYSEGRCRFN
ncbi:CLUMA_CG009110, isoform A [Clunio marinus]|uniref:CLUMA_CG009110, isoform A n=1 Tax=Clunio marinus TaxID=568069 RepID=A0A1J1I7U9_9DIPT|nr:CLUMA_CG009110, isoform A [Clunio marinus]